MKRLVVEAPAHIHTAFKTEVCKRGTTIREVLLSFIEVFLAESSKKKIEPIDENPEKTSGIRTVEEPVEEPVEKPVEIHTVEEPAEVKESVKMNPAEEPAEKSTRKEFDGKTRTTKLCDSREREEPVEEPAEENSGNPDDQEETELSCPDDSFPFNLLRQKKERKK